MSMDALASRALLIKILAAGTTYGFTILLARNMLTEDFGTIAFFLNLSLVLSVCGACGQQMAALRFAPQRFEDKDQSGLQQLSTWAFRRSAICTLFVCFLALIGAVLAKATGNLSSVTAAQIWLGFLLIPLVGWVDLQSHLARACGELGLSLVPKEILWRGIASVAVVILLTFQDIASVTATSVLLILVSVLVLIAGAQAFVLTKTVGIDFRIPVLPTTDVADWKSAAGPFWLTSVSNIFLANADVVILGLFAGPGVAGVYFAANRLAMLLSFFLTSYNVVLTPRLAHVWQSSGTPVAQELLHEATLKTTVSTTLFAAILFLFTPQFLALFGPGFLMAEFPFRLLLLAALINVTCGPADIALNMCGFHRDAMHASAISLVVSILFLSLGALFGGATGVAFGVLIATTIRKFLFWLQAVRRLSIRTDIWAAIFQPRPKLAEPNS